jgi:hypothetical protein
MVAGIAWSAVGESGVVETDVFMGSLHRFRRRILAAILNLPYAEQKSRTEFPEIQNHAWTCGTDVKNIISSWALLVGDLQGSEDDAFPASSSLPPPDPTSERSRAMLRAVPLGLRACARRPIIHRQSTATVPR